MIKSKQKKREIFKRIVSKHFFRKIRSRLKRKLYDGGVVARRIKRQYHLDSKNHYSDLKAFKQNKLESKEIVIPKHFSFFRDPTGTSKFFKDLDKILSKHKPFKFFISHEKTEEIELAASFLFDQKIREYKIYWENYRIKINVSGKISDSKKVNNFLLSFGILNELGISAKTFSLEKVDLDYSDKYITRKLRGSKKIPSMLALASVSLIDYFDNCLKYNGLTLSRSTKTRLVESIGEIIGNAEEHCGNDIGHWAALGCYNKDDHNCSFAIVNYGKTIFENLSDATSTAAEVIHKIEDVINQHRPILQKIHGLFFQKGHEEPIWNIMALQDGISSRRTAQGRGRTRGQGIMDVLSFIEEVKAPGDSAEICLISGHSAIKIDYRYSIQNKLVGVVQEKRRIITFNKELDLKRTPDSDKVMFIDTKFPGTIFVGSFRIDKKFLEINEKVI